MCLQCFATSCTASDEEVNKDLPSIPIEHAPISNYDVNDIFFSIFFACLFLAVNAYVIERLFYYLCLFINKILA